MSRRSTLGALLVVLALMVLPAGAQEEPPPTSHHAESYSVQVAIDRDLIQISYRTPFDGRDADPFRLAMDDGGAGDGTVTSDEVAEWQEKNRLAARDPDCIPSDFELVTFKGQRPAALVPSTFVKATGAEGPTIAGGLLEMFVLFSFVPERPLLRGDEVSIYLGAQDQLYPLWKCLFMRDLPVPERGGLPHIFIGTEGFRVKRPASIDLFTTGHDGRGLESSGDSGPTLFSQRVVLEYDGEHPLDGAIVPILAGGLGFLVVALFASTLASATIRERFVRLLAMGVLPFYTRIRREKALDHKRRERLYAFIRDHQGATFSDLRRELDIRSGALAHHLHVLEGQGFVQAYRDGLRDRFYLKGPKVQPDAYLTRTQQALLAVIAKEPGITQKEVARRVGLTRQSVAHHEGALIAKGLLRAEPAGRSRRYFAEAP